MNKQELIELIKVNPISDESKKKIFNLLEQNELDDNTKEQIRDIIQEDIETNDPAEFTPEDLKKINEITEQTTKELSAVQKGVEDDMKFVEGEFNDLEATVNELDKIADEAQIDSIRSDIKNTK